MSELKAIDSGIDSDSDSALLDRASSCRYMYIAFPDKAIHVYIGEIDTCMTHDITHENHFHKLTKLHLEVDSLSGLLAVLAISGIDACMTHYITHIENYFHKLNQVTSRSRQSVAWKMRHRILSTRTHAGSYKYPGSNFIIPGYTGIQMYYSRLVKLDVSDANPQHPRA